MAASELGKKYVIVVAKSMQATLKTSLKAHQQISKKKTVFRKLLFVWYNMPIFNFTGYTLTELFRKPDNWRQIYKQTSSTFYTSKKKLLGRHNKGIFLNTFAK